MEEEAKKAGKEHVQEEIMKATKKSANNKGEDGAGEGKSDKRRGE